MRGALIKVNSESLPKLKENEYYFHEIIGMTVITTGNVILGKITDIIETGSNEVYCVKGNNKEYLIPAIRDVIDSINKTEGIIKIKPMGGMLD